MQNETSARDAARTVACRSEGDWARTAKCPPGVAEGGSALAKYEMPTRVAEARVHTTPRTGAPEVLAEEATWPQAAGLGSDERPPQERTANT